MLNWSLATWSLLGREVRRFVRQTNRLVGALLQPLLFWLLIGAGMNASFRPGGANGPGYMEYFFPGIILMILLFTSIFSTMSIIEDRREGFLQGVLVAPAPRSAMVTGKVLGGTLLGVCQALLFLLLLLTPWLHCRLTLAGFAALVALMFVLGFCLTTIGFVMAWPMESSQGYHALMSVLLLPLWVFSGAVFPTAGAPMWLTAIMHANPLTHGLTLLRQCFYLGDPTMPALSPGYVAGALAYVLLVTVALFALALRLSRYARQD